MRQARHRRTMTSQPRVRRALRYALIAVGTVLLLAGALGIEVAASIPSMRHAAAEMYPPPEAAPPGAAASAGALPFDPRKPTVAVVMGEGGANVADTLAPYEVFARTGGFNTYLVAPSARPVTLGGGLTVVPQHSFASLAATVPDGPAIIVVPQLHGHRGPVTDWLTAQYRDNTQVTFMSVCVGAEYLAETHILDGKSATSHWLKLIGLRRGYPGITWVAGKRFVEDGRVISTAGVLSGIDGALRLTERFLGADAATVVADEIRWPGYRPGAGLDIPVFSPGPADLPAVLSAAFGWNRPEMGVLVTSGVGEIELASAYRPYTELSYLAMPQTLSSTGQSVTTVHGVTVIPRGRMGVRDVDRVVVPGRVAADEHVADAVRRDGTNVDYLHTRDEFAFDGAIRDIATHYDRATARWVAKSLQYPTDTADAGTSAWPWSLTGIALGLLLLIAVVLLGLCLLIRAAIRAVLRRRRVRQDPPEDQPAESSAERIRLLT